jgi:hypothetical protein
MSIIRDLALSVLSLEDKAFVTLSTAQIAGAGGFFSTMHSTANVKSACTTEPGLGVIEGRVIDRLSDLFTKDIPLVACPATFLNSTRGSTQLDRKLTLGVKLQHGDSSGGGDMADYSTGSQPADKVYFTSARTTAFANWSTGALKFQSNAAFYDLRAAKRYIRAVHSVTINNVTTESTGDEGDRVSGAVVFLGNATPRPDLLGVGSTSTST